MIFVYLLIGLFLLAGLNALIGLIGHAVDGLTYITNKLDEKFNNEKKGDN